MTTLLVRGKYLKIMGTPRFRSDFPDHFVNNNITISNKKDTANTFNNYFTNIGPELSNITFPTKRFQNFIK